MIQTYQFKVALNTRKDLWRRIEIKSDQTLRDFDYILRDVFHHDPDDHLSEFFRGRPWHSACPLWDNDVATIFITKKTVNKSKQRVI